MGTAPFPVHTISGQGHFIAGRPPLAVHLAQVRQMVPPHDHRFLEIVLVIRGRADHLTSRRRVLTTCGDVWIIRPGHWHTYMAPRGLQVYNVLIGPEVIRGSLSLLRMDPGAVEVLWGGPATQAGDGCCLLHLSTAERLEAEALLQALARDLAAPAPPSFLACAGRLWIFLALLARQGAKPSGSQAPARPAAGPGGPFPAEPRLPAVVEAIELIESRYADPLAAADLAAATGVSPSHLRKIFRRLTGQAPLEYLASVRIQHACRLLLETELAVTEIAGRVGWSDPNLFARRFRAVLGLSPRAYRTTRPQPGTALAAGGGRG